MRRTDIPRGRASAPASYRALNLPASRQYRSEGVSITLATSFDDDAGGSIHIASIAAPATGYGAPGLRSLEDSPTSERLHDLHLLLNRPNIRCQDG